MVLSYLIELICAEISVSALSIFFCSMSISVYRFVYSKDASICLRSYSNDLLRVLDLWFSFLGALRKKDLSCSMDWFYLCEWFCFLGIRFFFDGWESLRSVGCLTCLTLLVIDRSFFNFFINPISSLLLIAIKSLYFHNIMYIRSDQFLKVLLNLNFLDKFPRDLVRGRPHSLTLPITILLAIFTEYFSFDSYYLAILLMSS